MRFDKLSPKQAEIFKFPHQGYDALICDGAVRSGKTMMMIFSFILWAMESFDGALFAICGKTVQSAERNIISPLLETKSLTDRYSMTYTRSMKLLTVRRKGKTNYFYTFGGRDESSYMLIQGLTLSGVILDEVALMPRSFVEQAITRTLSIDDAKLWFNCNPENPMHWFYAEWILKADEHNAKHLHFLMTDNPGLSKRAIEKAERDFTGVFYERYVLGRWVVAEGLVYPMFSGDFHVIPDNKMPHNQRTAKQIAKRVSAYEKYLISCDYGTKNPCAFILWGVCAGVYYAIDEYYYDGRKLTPRTDDEHYAALKELAGGRQISRVIIDPSAASFITLIIRKKEFLPLEADNAVIDGIRETGTALKNGLLKFSSRCKNTIKEFGLYLWNEKKSDDEVIKEHDHAMDAIRYLVKTLRIAVPKIRSTK